MDDSGSRRRHPSTVASLYHTPDAACVDTAGAATTRHRRVAQAVDHSSALLSEWESLTAAFGQQVAALTRSRRPVPEEAADKTSARGGQTHHPADCFCYIADILKLSTTSPCSQSVSGRGSAGYAALSTSSHERQAARGCQQTASTSTSAAARTGLSSSEPCLARHGGAEAAPPPLSASPATSLLVEDPPTYSAPPPRRPHPRDFSMAETRSWQLKKYHQPRASPLPPTARRGSHYSLRDGLLSGAHAAEGPSLGMAEHVVRSNGCVGGQVAAPVLCWRLAEEESAARLRILYDGFDGLAALHGRYYRLVG
ncbi:hypothetical protein STCU_10949 [Strigomonas culicis]|uniref:Uncharacterized protein n=1 Tax=Strigomonas culicis TaxID=28005 RepID=S9TFK1_9TRYP|nr:hypothetical protein STCU_10949 [Strigomonas culicis]|eukprot:EPY16852.1 hypothetical protein STCU_10949 [Strigomonas culicis]